MDALWGRLERVGGRKAGNVHVLRGTHTIVLGRKKGCTIRLKSPNVSSKHCTLRPPAGLGTPCTICDFRRVPFVPRECVVPACAGKSIRRVAAALICALRCRARPLPPPRAPVPPITAMPLN